MRQRTEAALPPQSGTRSSRGAVDRAGIVGQRVHKQNRAGRQPAGRRHDRGAEALPRGKHEMKRSIIRSTLLGAVLGARCASSALALGSAIGTTANPGDNLWGYHVFGTDPNSRGFSIDAGSDLATASPIWSFGYDTSTTSNNNDFFLYSHTYNGTGTGILNGYFLRMRGDNGMMDLGPNLNHPGSSAQLKIWAGTNTAPKDGLSVACYGNYNGIFLDQNNAGTQRTKINFFNQFMIGSDSGGSGTSKDWWLFNNNTGRFPLLVSDNTNSDVVSMGYGATVGGTFKHTGSMLGFYNAAPVAKPTITGCRSDGTALANLLTALKNMGLINDSTTP